MASRSWNRVELIGNATKDPELRYTPNGAAVCTFSIATNRTFVTDGEKREETDFHRAVAWNKLAELCAQLIKKGNRVFISGRLQNRSWETADGQNRQTTEIVIEDMLLLTSKGPGNYADTTEEPASDHEVPARSVEEMPTQIKSDQSDQSEKSGKSEESEKAEEPEKEEKVAAVEDKSDQSEVEKPKAVENEEVGDLDDLPF